MRCVLLSAGWFFNDELDVDGKFSVAESGNASIGIPAGCRFYGPAAWDGGDGPMYGRELVIARPERWAEWSAQIDNSLSDEGSAVIEDLRPWPAKLTVTSAGRDKGLALIDGVIVHSESEFLSRVEFFAQQVGAGIAVLSTAEERRQAANAHMKSLVGGNSTLH